tara:strand:+ start:60246 stop:60734 length:489 start_codon:yes stop_codon:yes gene_type:complete
MEVIKFYLAYNFMLKTCRKRKQFIHLQKIKHKWKKIAIYKPTQLQAEVILQMAEGKGLKVYESTKYRILQGYSTDERNTYIIYNGKEFIGGNKNDVDKYLFKVLSFPEFIAAIDVYKETVKVQITDSYEAELTEKGIKVGCQLITYDKFDELKKAVKKYKKQ